MTALFFTDEKLLGFSIDIVPCLPVYRRSCSAWPFKGRQSTCPVIHRSCEKYGGEVSSGKCGGCQIRRSVENGGGDGGVFGVGGGGITDVV